MRLGLIGAGRFGRRYLSTLAEVRGARLLAVASRNPATAALLPSGCRMLRDWREMLARVALDGVLVVTPPPTHAVIVTAAMDAGLAVLVEKPLTLDLAEARQLACRPRRAPVMVEHTHLFAPAYRALRTRCRAAIANGARITRVEVLAGAHGPFRPDTPVLWDWGSHWVAVCLDLFGGPPVAVRARVVERLQQRDGIGETVEAGMEYSSGATARVLVSNLLASPTRRLLVETDRERIVYDELCATPLVWSRLDQEQRFPIDIDTRRPLSCALQYFVDACQRHAQGERNGVDSNLDFGVAVVTVLDRLQGCLGNGER